jgi:Cell division protein CrgA
MPESRVRKKAPFTPPAAKSAARKPNPRWYAPLMLTLMVLGLVWVVVFYISQTAYPIPKIGNLNLVIGFGILLAGFGMTTRWR